MRARLPGPVALLFLTLLCLCPLNGARAQLVAPPAPAAGKSLPAAPQSPSNQSLTPVACPVGAIMVPDTVLGTVCHVMKTGVNLVMPRDGEQCPVGYRLIVITSLPYCSSNVAGLTQGPTNTALLGESEACPPGHVPLIDDHGLMECTINPQMDPLAVFNPATDCPVGTYAGVKNNLMGCIQR